MKQVSVIILNWNGSRLLREYLPSVVENTNRDVAEIIVADNGSTDNSLEILEKEFPEVRVISLGQNFGFAKGYNLAISQIDTPYCVLLNDDVRVSRRWLEPLLAHIETNENIAAMQPKILSDRDPSLFEYAGAAGGFLDCFGYPYCRGRIFETIERDEGQYDLPAKIMWASGACLLVKTELYRQVGGLDENFFAHMEEIDLCWRLRNNGYDIVCLPDSSVYHYGGASLAMGNPRKTMLNFRNSLLMLNKNLPKERRRKIIFTRKCLDFVAAMNFLLHGQYKHTIAIWTAHREAAKMLREIYQKGTTPNNEKEAEIMPESKVSILKEYYLRGKKTYKKLNLH